MFQHRIFPNVYLSSKLGNIAKSCLYVKIVALTLIDTVCIILEIVTGKKSK